VPFENDLVRYAFLAIFALVLAGLLYFVSLGARALFRQAQELARGAGYSGRSASVRAMVRMGLWAAYFAAFYLLAFYLGKRLAWWAVPGVAAALAVTVWSLVLADRLLTVTPGNVRAQAGIGGTLAVTLGIFVAIILIVA